MMELEDFFYTYPSLEDPHFQHKIYQKKEFKLLTVGDPKKEEKTPQGYYFHQEYVHRYMLIYDFLILIWEAGAGKTIGALGAAERFRQYLRTKEVSYPESYFQPTHTYIRKAIILVKNQNLKSVFMDTLITVMHSQTGFSRTIDIKNDGFYHIYTYTEFYKLAKDILGNIDEETKFSSEQINLINEEYRDTFFIIDEAHTFSRAALSIKKISKKKKNEKEETTLTYAKLYQTIYNVIKIAQNIKFMALTATPMIDQIEEAVYLVNLVLAKSDISMPTNRNAYLFTGKKGEELSLDIKMSPQKLAKYFKGIISYTGVRYAGVEIIESGKPLNINVTGANIATGRSKKYFETQITKDITYEEDLSVLENIEIEAGEEIGDFLKTQIIVDKCYMRGLQLLTYLKEEIDENEVENEGGEVEAKTKKSKTLHVNTRHIRNFVFPDPENIEEGDGLYGRTAIDMYKKKKIIKEEGNTITFNQNFINIFFPGGDEKDRIGELSCVFERAFDIIQYHLDNKPGVIYIFFDLLISGAMIFESLLKAKFDFSLYTYIEGIEGLRKPRNRLVYLTGKSKNIQKTLNKVNETKNWNGDYIKIVIGSKATSESYSIKNVTTIIQMEPDWNFGRSYQAIKRGIRKDGFDALKQKVREGVIKGPIPVSIHRMGALIPVKVLSGGTKDDVDGATIDSNRYALGLEKDLKIKRMEHSLRTAAIDCESNRTVNIDPKNKDFSPRALYDINNYMCDDKGGTKRKNRTKKIGLSNIKPKGVESKKDDSSWVLLHSTEQYSKVKEMVILELRNNNMVQSDYLIGKTVKITGNEDVAINLLGKILKNQVMGNDRYGFNKYVRESNGYIYLSDYLLDQQENYNEIIYSSDLTFSYTQKLGDYFDRIIRTKITNRIPLLSYSDYKEEFDVGGLIQKTIIFEDVIRRYAIIVASGKPKKLNKKYKDLLPELEDYYITINRPISLIDHVGDRMFDRVLGGKHRGPRPQNKLDGKLYWLLDDFGVDWNNIKIKDEQDTEIGKLVYIHYAIIFTASAPAAGRGLRRFRDRLRILEPPYNEWKTIDSENTPVEQQTYENIVSDHLVSLDNSYKNEIMNIETINKEKIYGPGWYFGRDEYDLDVLKNPLSPVYLTENLFNKKVRIVAPEWFREKYSVVKVKSKDKEDGRKKASGRELKTGFSIQDLKTIYIYFRPDQVKTVLGKDSYIKKIIEELRELGLITNMHN